MNIIDIIMRNTFETANEAYEYFHNEIITNGVEFAGTKALFNIGFTIENPTNKVITNKERNWNEEYAAAEWAWYLSGDPRIKTLGELYGKIPAIWKRMADSNGEVNSNYGYQWRRNDQLENVINMLKKNPDTRQAAISIYDGKTIHQYAHDTPCTYAVQFTIVQSKLYMSVYMRSNDLWYGFCNDQYQFASLQEMVAERLNLPVGTYYHHAHNLHLYNDKI
ncbi:MAG: thymidylate synthase [Aliivibrio sp.]|nr:thymidylate synthase [Aliivibrio sp.]MCP4326412.1 thymidylate synthase [Alteromonadales bacterium]